MSDTGRRTRAGSESIGFFGPLERSGVARGLLLLVVAVVIGVLLLPSATRPGLGTTAASTVTTPTTTPHVKLPISRSTTSTTTASTPVSSVKVLVANGTNSNGAATAVMKLLAGKGFGTLTPVDALTVVPSSEVYAIGGDDAAAQEVAAALGLSASAIQPAATPVPVASDAGATVVVVVGPDLVPS